MTSTDYAVRTPAGSTVFTSSDKSLAIRWAKDRVKEAEGLVLTVEEVNTTVARRRVWRSGFNLVRAA